MKNSMIINCVKTGKTPRDGTTSQEYERHKHTMFPTKIIVSTCADIATIMKNYWRHKKEEPKTQTPHVKKRRGSRWMAS